MQCPRLQYDGNELLIVVQCDFPDVIFLSPCPDQVGTENIVAFPEGQCLIIEFQYTHHCQTTLEQDRDPQSGLLTGSGQLKNSYAP